MSRPFMGDGKIVTGANAISAFRFWCAVMAFAAILRLSPVEALIWGLIGVFSDLFDGKVAKRGWLGGASNLGKILDPIADKIMILLPLVGIGSALFILGYSKEAWFVLAGAAIVAVREIVIWRTKKKLFELEGIQSAIESARASMVMQSAGFIGMLFAWAFMQVDLVMFCAGVVPSASLVAAWDYVKRLSRLRRERELALV